VDSLRIDLPHPTSTERTARIAESENVQDDRQRRKDGQRKGRRIRRSDESRTEAESDRAEENVGKVLDVEA
jgi:hypothetical protein